MLTTKGIRTEDRVKLLFLNTVACNVFGASYYFAINRKKPL
jgi:hypothetical protein